MGFLNRSVIVVALLAGSITLVTAGGQAPAESRLKQLFPAATAFSPKEGDPPHFKAYSGTGTSRAVIGYAFWTTEVSPLERGYGGPIAMLMGLDAKGLITGVIIGEHHEPYGTLKLHVDDEVVAEDEIRTIASRYSLCGEGLCIGYDGGDAVSGEYKPKFEFTGGKIVKVVFDVADDAYVDLEHELAAALARD